MKKLALLLALCLLLGCTACAAGDGASASAGASSGASATSAGGEDAGATAAGWAEQMNAFLEKFPAETGNSDEAIEGGTLRVALPSAVPFPGILNRQFANDLVDYQIMQWFTGTLLTVDESYRYSQDGAATYTYDQEAKTVTLTMKEGVKWHDGAPVTMDDLVFGYEIMAHPEYENSIFYESQIKNVEGAEAYRLGEASAISGLTLSDDNNTLTIQFIEFTPSILLSGFFSWPAARHYYGELDFADIAGHERTRLAPLGFGPFKVVSITPGERVELEAFADYWQGAPKLDSIVMEVVNPDLLPTAMAAGEYDIAAFPAASYQDHQQPQNYSYLGRLDSWYGFTAFQLGHLDAETYENVADPEAKMANKALRQAIGYAVDNASIGSQLYGGLSFPAPTALPATASHLADPAIPGYPYSPDKANALLDEAGYVDVDGDGYREDPAGEAFTIQWLVGEGDGMDTVAMYKIQNWADVGLRVEMMGGGPMETISFYAELQSEAPAYDMFDHAWQTEGDPNPSLFWGKTAYLNLGHYASDEMDALLAALNAPENFDEAALAQSYHAWQAFFQEEAPAIATTWRGSIFAVNARVKNYSVVPPAQKPSWHLIELTAEEPFSR